MSDNEGLDGGGPMELVLASTSRYRHELLSRLRVAFRSIAPGVDEGAFVHAGIPAEQLAVVLARAKADAVLAIEHDATVIGSDQVCVLDNGPIGKPGSRLHAIEQLASLAGRVHDLVTAVCVCRHNRHGDVERQEHVDLTRMRVRPLRRDEIERYIDADEPYDCAGSYRLESLGISLFERIESADHTAIVGLPLMATADMLRLWGWQIP